MQEVLAGLSVHVGENPQPDRVHVARPEAIRARRFEAVLVLGLQEGEFPGGARPEPFLPDDVRREIAMASGLVLPLREDRLDRERYLFYVCASRAERLLVLSSRTSDEEGTPEAPSFFLDDVRELLVAGSPPRVRSLGEVTWTPEEAPTAAEWDRALAARGPRREERLPGTLTAAPLLAAPGGAPGALGELARALRRLSGQVAGGERPAARGARARPRADGARPARSRGAGAHVQARGARRPATPCVTRANLAAAERILLEELERSRSKFRLSPKQTRVRAAARRLEFDLLRHLGREAERDGSFAPHSLELRFGEGEGTEYGPVEIGQGLLVSGRIDRVDTADGHGPGDRLQERQEGGLYKVASWESENRFQAALYMLAVEKLLGRRAVGGVYVALGAEDPRPRGMLADDVPALGSGWVGNDRVPPEVFAEKLDWARERIGATAAAIRRGELTSTPDSCAYRGGCSYPSLCRCER